MAIPRSGPDARWGGMPFVTIVTVVLDDAEGLRRTARSVIAQHGIRFEWIVVDGGSTDGTLAVIQDLSLQIAHWSSGPDKGVYDAMNKGVAAASGDYVLFMNAGDGFADPASLAGLASAAACDRPGMICAGAAFVYPGGITLRRRPRPAGSCLWHHAPCSHQAMLTRTDLLRQTPFDLRFAIAADYALVCQLFVQGTPIALHDEIVAVTAHGGTSLSHRKAWTLLMEKASIQRRILNSSLVRICASALWRSATIITEHLLSLRWPRPDASPRPDWPPVSEPGAG